MSEAPKTPQPKTKAITIRWPAEYFGRLEQTARRAGKPSTYGFVKDLAEQACERSERGQPIDGDDLEGVYSQQYVTELTERITSLEDDVVARGRLITQRENDLAAMAQEVQRLEAEREGWLADTQGPATNQPLCPACGEEIEGATHFAQTLTGALGIDEANVVVHSCEGPAKELYDRPDLPSTPTGVIPGQQQLPQQAAPQQLPPTANPNPDPAWQHQHETKPLGTPDNPAPIGTDSPLSVQGVPLVVDHRNEIPGGRPPAQLPPGVACTHKVAEWTDDGKVCATCGAVLAA